MHIRPTCLAAALLAIASVGGSAAQEPAPPDPADQPPVAGPVFGGVVAGLAGIIAGGYAGYGLECADGCPGDFGGFGGAVLGAVTGEMLLLPVGVHLGNGGRGSLAADFTASLLSGAGGMVVAALTEPDFLYVVPFIQLTATVLAERNSARSRAERRLRIGVAPTARGLVLVGTLRF